MCWNISPTCRPYIRFEICQVRLHHVAPQKRLKVFICSTCPSLKQAANAACLSQENACSWVTERELSDDSWMLHAGMKQQGEPTVQQYLWQARKKHDCKVPVSRTSAGPDTDTYISAAGVSHPYSASSTLAGHDLWHRPQLPCFKSLLISSSFPEQYTQHSVHLRHGQCPAHR